MLPLESIIEAYGYRAQFAGIVYASAFFFLWREIFF
jgi:hypothetical protein